MKAIILFVLLFMAVPAAFSQTTYYIDYSSGSNSNNGTSKATPWKSHPFMQNASGCSTPLPTYTHHSGDQFIFKGGVSWPAACFGMGITQGGTTTTSDYYGVDLTWFTGGSFSRPIFNLNNTAPLGTTFSGGTSFSVIMVRAANVTLDNLEITGQFIKGGHGQSSMGFDCGVYFNAVGGGLVENSFFHDWVSDTTNINAGWSNCAGGIGQDAGGYNANNVTISGQNSMDLTRGVQVSFGGCFGNPTEVKNSHCHHVGQGVNGFISVHDSEFYNLSAAGTSGPYTNAMHTNDVQQTFPAGAGSVYNNLFHDNSTGQHVGVCPTGNVYNNVFWNISGGSSAPIGVDSGINACTVNSSTVMNIYNNTVDCTGGLPNCISIGRNGAAFGPVNIKNNHFIVNSGQVVIANTAKPSAINQVTNITMSPATATAQGYTIANKYRAFPVTAPTTVNAGTNLSGVCSGGLSALCSDTQGAPWFGASYVPRPTGTAAWDVGAYQSSTSFIIFTLAPSPVAFGNQNVSTSSNPITITLTNHSAVTQTLNTPYFTVTGTNPGDFTNAGGSCANNHPVLGGGTCTTIFKFTPSALGGRSATLTVSAAGGTPNVTDSLTGTGTSAPIPVVQLGPRLVNFGTVNTGTSSPTTTFTLTNIGTATLTITSITTSDSTHFPLVNSCGASLAVNTSCTFTDAFSPTANGFQSGTLTVTTNAASSPDTISVSGTGFTPNPQPPPAPAPMFTLEARSSKWLRSY